MRRVEHVRALLGVVLTVILAGCVTLPPNSKPAPQDPWESWNRGVYKVNDKLDRAVAKPIARTYVRAVPAPARTGVSNFLANLRTTTVMINDALQGKFLAAGNDLARLVVNTTIGFGGLLDPAIANGFEQERRGFRPDSRTLGRAARAVLGTAILGPVRHA